MPTQDGAKFGARLWALANPFANRHAVHAQYLRHRNFAHPVLDSEDGNGTSRGIGAALARRLAAEGASVAVR
jgi:hypothetical protein